MGNNKSMSDNNKMEQNGTEWKALALDQAEQIAGMGSWDYNVETADFKWTEGMYRLFNIPSGTNVTPDIYLDFTPKDERNKVKRIVKSIKNEFASFQEMITILPAGQAKKLVLIKAVVIRDENNKPRSVIGVDLDVTEQTETEDKINDLVKTLRKKNRELESLNSELKTFNTIAATDYKETLRHVYTSLEFIISNDAYNLSNAGRANIRRAQAALQKMNLLTDDIVEYSGIHAPSEAPVKIDVNDLLKAVRDDLQKLVTDTSAIIEYRDCPALYGYPQLLSLLFHHLIQNAIKFRKEDDIPRIHIEHSKKQGTEIEYPSAEVDKAYNVISVKDNGNGFNQEEAEKIFEIFSRLHQKDKYKGSGIGLAICKKIMDIHGGFITASAEEGKGAAFSCYFPLQIS